MHLCLLGQRGLLDLTLGRVECRGDACGLAGERAPDDISVAGRLRRVLSRSCGGERCRDGCTHRGRRLRWSGLGVGRLLYCIGLGFGRRRMFVVAVLASVRSGHVRDRFRDLGRGLRLAVWRTVLLLLARWRLGRAILRRPVDREDGLDRRPRGRPRQRLRLVARLGRSDALGSSLGLVLEWVVGLADLGPCRRRGASAPRLDDVLELVGDQLLPALRHRVERPRTEEDVLADREGLGVDGRRGVDRDGIGVDAHPREGHTELGVHLAA